MLFSIIPNSRRTILSLKRAAKMAKARMLAVMETPRLQPVLRAT